MKQFLPLQKAMSVLLVLSMVHLCWLTSYGWAEMVGTQEVLNQETQIKITREMLIDALNREEVQEQLELYGIAKVEATARIISLTDEEVTRIAGRLDELPVGSGGGCTRITSADGSVREFGSSCDPPDLGAVLAVILVLLVLVLLFYWVLKKKNNVDFPSSKEDPASETVEEDLHEDKTEADYTSSSEDGY